MENRTIKESFIVKIAKRIEEIPPQDWNKVFPLALENYYFFKTLDESDFFQFSFFYIIVYNQGAPAGATSCFLMDYPLDAAVSGPFKKLTNFIRRLAPRILNPKILICGLPMGQGRIGIAGEPIGVMRAIYEGMEKIAEEEKAGIIAFKDFASSYNNTLDDFLKDGFFKVQSLPSTEMDISFDSFDQYLNSLSSVTRSGLKRKFKKSDAKVKIDLEVTDELKADALAEVYALYMQTYQRQDVSFEKIPPDFFRNISRNMPQETKFFLWRIHGRIVTFAYCLVSEDYFIDYYLGFDYSLAHDNNLYLIRFRGLLNWCIKNKIKKYEMGPTSYEPKRRLGFNFIRLYIYAKHRNKLINPILKLFSHLLKPENFDPVFKELRKT